MKLKISQILESTGGTLLCGSEDVIVQSFFSDSRQIKKDGMFIPIRGEHTDSHQFIGEVFENGASASFTEIPLLDLETMGLPIQVPGKCLVLVPDSRTALQKAAAYYRTLFNIPVIGVTGSAGKTTAKEMIALALSSRLNTLKTAGNQNSQIGVPLTVCQLKKKHQAAVVEMGVSIPGEMSRLAQVVKPGYAVVTNIGVSHIEFLNSRENIMAEKLHIADYIPPEGTLFVNGDDDLLSTLKGAHQACKVVTFGVSRGCDWCASSIRQVGNGMFFTCEFLGKSKEIFLPAVGVHNIRNALASLAVAYALDVDIESAIRALASYKPPAMRQQIMQLPGEITLIDDSYNASPDSVRGAVDILITLKPDGSDKRNTEQNKRTIAVLGDMLELGSESEKAHLEISHYAADNHVDFMIGVGDYAKQLCDSFGADSRAEVKTAAGALEVLRAMLQPGDVVLVKGSRGIHLDEVVKGLLD